MKIHRLGPESNSKSWVYNVKTDRTQSSGSIAQQMRPATGLLASRCTVTRRLYKDDLFAHCPERCMPLTATHWWHHLQ
ncbi:hypothetical protein TNCV_2646651 [Trichonephila clavipes]|nr:hypothetical protein TNCV_2646651 [Trichonephila clavipes]